MLTKGPSASFPCATCLVPKICLATIGVWQRRSAALLQEIYNNAKTMLHTHGQKTAAREYLNGYSMRYVYVSLFLANRRGQSRRFCGNSK